MYSDQLSAEKYLLALLFFKLKIDIYNIFIEPVREEMMAFFKFYFFFYIHRGGREAAACYPHTHTHT